MLGGKGAWQEQGLGLGRPRLEVAAAGGWWLLLGKAAKLITFYMPGTHRKWEEWRRRLHSNC